MRKNAERGTAQSLSNPCDFYNKRMLDPTADAAETVTTFQHRFSKAFQLGLTGEQGVFMIDTGYHIMQQINSVTDRDS